MHDKEFPGVEFSLSGKFARRKGSWHILHTGHCTIWMTASKPISRWFEIVNEARSAQSCLVRLMLEAERGPKHNVIGEGPYITTGDERTGDTIQKRVELAGQLTPTRKERQNEM